MAPTMNIWFPKPPTISACILIFFENTMYSFMEHFGGIEPFLYFFHSPSLPSKTREIEEEFSRLKMDMTLQYSILFQPYGKAFVDTTPKKLMVFCTSIYKQSPFLLFFWKLDADIPRREQLDSDKKTTETTFGQPRFVSFFIRHKTDLYAKNFPATAPKTAPPNVTPTKIPTFFPSTTLCFCPGTSFFKSNPIIIK